MESGRWLVELQGEARDLAVIERIVAKDAAPPWTTETGANGELLLGAAAWETLDEPAAREAASHAVHLLCGLALLRKRRFETVTIRHLMRRRPDGTTVYIAGTALIAFASVEAHGTSTVTSPDGTVAPAPPPPPPPPLLASLAEDRHGPADATLARALTLFAESPHDWTTLYRVFEVIQSGAPTQLKVWARKAEIYGFGKSANHPAAGGRNARHAVLPGSPPAGPHLTLGEGEAFIRRLLGRWVDSRKDDLTTSAAAAKGEK